MGDLQISPQELRFRFELKKTIPVTLSLSNAGKELIAFKVKTTSPKKYCVRPSSGVVEPGSTKDVQVIMQAQREYPPSLEDVKDKFLVQYTVAAPGTREVGPDTFDPANNKDVRQTKLRVLLVAPPKPPSPVPEGVEEEPSPAKPSFKEDSYAMAARGGDDSSLVKERNKYKEELSKALKEKADLKKRVELLELQGQGRRGGQQKIVRSGFSTWIVLLVAVIAFLLGKFLAAGAKGLPGISMLNDVVGGNAEL